MLVVDAGEMLEIAGHEVTPRLLAIAQDVDAGTLLIANREPQRIALGFGQHVALDGPWRPQLARLREPRWFGQTADDGSLQ
jgi:hypothetical protein